MSRIGVAKCPKCGGQMSSGSVAGDFRILKEGDLMGDRAQVIYCSVCGFVELYKEPSGREPWRLRASSAEPEPTQTSVKEETQKPEEESSRKPAKKLVR